MPRMDVSSSCHGWMCCFVTPARTWQEVMEKNKKIQQDKKVAYDLKVAEASGQLFIPFRGPVLR